MLDLQTKIYVAGHRGLVGSAIVRTLEQRGFRNIVVRKRDELDLMNALEVHRFFTQEQPEVVIDAAARVGGIMANIAKPAEFIRENLQIQNNLIHQAYVSGVKKLTFLGSSCIYPRLAPQPLREEYYMSGPLEPTNESYAIAKIAGIRMCQAYNEQYGTDFISVLPTNIFGYHDHFDLETAHVLQAMIHRFHLAKETNAESVVLMGSGNVYREFMFADDAADAILFLTEHYSGNDPINVGTGVDVTLKELATIVKEVVGFHGEIVWDTSRPDGMPRKLMCVEKLNRIGWKPRYELEEGIRLTYQWFLEKVECKHSFA